MRPQPLGASGWSPDPMPEALANSPRLGVGPAWDRWLRLQGYDDDEIDELREDTPGDPDDGLAEQLGLAVARAERLAAESDRPFDVDARALVVRGTAARYLEQRPPHLVETLDPRPIATLSAEALGARLRPLGKAWRMGAGRYRDRLTGRAWWALLGGDPLQRGQVIIAGALYRLVGVAALAWRQVRIGELDGIACPEPAEWAAKGAKRTGQEHGRALARELAADAWLGNQGLAGGLLARELVLPDSPELLRDDLRGCLQWRAPGRPASPRAFAGGLPQEYSAALSALIGWRAALYATAQAQPDLVAQGVARVEAITDDEIATAVQLGGLTLADAGELAKRLRGRRDALAAAQ